METGLIIALVAVVCVASLRGFSKAAGKPFCSMLSYQEFAGMDRTRYRTAQQDCLRISDSAVLW